MNTKRRTLELTDLQLSHTIAAIQWRMKYLMQQADEVPEGGAHEDYLIAQSILTALQEAKVAED